MADSIGGFLAHLRAARELTGTSEEAIRQGAILPLLARLGWNAENVGEVVPEFGVGTRYVDYCLRIKGREAVFIEAKKSGEDLDRHEEQLLDYAFRSGVELAVLTNGILWWMYLPLLKGDWQQRKFLAIDIERQELDTVAQNFNTVLSRQAVESGSAAKEAKALHVSREKERLIEVTISGAWNQLCQEPDDLLVELLAERVESLCGHKPDPDFVTRFLKSALRSSVEGSVSKPPQVRRSQQKPWKIPVGDYREPILLCLLEAGGRAHVRDVLACVEEQMSSRLTDDDRQPLPSGTDVRWRNTAQWARNRMKEEGLLKKDSPRGTWELTERGRKAAAAP